jgi:tetratricopeptide (TPR) repeat protein
MGAASSGPTLSDKSPERRLDSWKEIATYLKRDVTTVQRWEKREAMPVHRHLHDKRGSVYAFAAELDVWMQSRSQRLEEEERSGTALNGGRSHEPLAAVRRWLSGERNRRRAFLVSGALAVVAVVALASWNAFSARPKLNETDIILLATFVNKTGDPIFDNSLDKALEVKLTESPFLSVLPEVDFRRTLGTMRQDPNQPVTKQLAIEICKRQGIKAVVVPEIAAFGNRYLITLEAVDAQSSKSIALRQEEAESKDKVITALGRAGSRLRSQLGETLSSLEKFNAPLDLATTASLEALQAYRTGQKPYRSGKRRESIPFFERAVELDPQFCSAYSMLGSAYHSTSDNQASRKNFARAFELKDGRLTQEENFQTTALYHSAITGNLEKETAVLLLYKQSYPRSAFAHNLLGIAYAQLGRTEESVREFYWAIDDSPVPSAQHYSNASQALMILGRFDEARKMLDRWKQKGSLTPFQVMLRYRIAVFDNDSATMEQLAHQAPGDEVLTGFQRDLAFGRGHMVEVRALSDALVKKQSQAKRMENSADELATLAGLESYAGNYVAARTLCRQAQGAGNDSALGLMLCAKALGDAGDLAQADLLAGKLDQQFPEDTSQQQVFLPVVRSVIERNRGNARKAADLLAPVTQFPNGLVFLHRGQAFLAAGDYSTAAADFQNVISHRGWPQWEVFAPLAQLGLARTYAMQRDRENSRKAYEDFFATWKNADPNLPLLIQAKGEYKKLAPITAASLEPGKN